MLSQSCGCLLCVGLAYVASNGLGGYFGVKENPLNSNIPFLILGLGVDDGFVLASEFARHTVIDPSASIPERIARTAKTGGISVLVTSATDGLAFLIGGSTKLPALSAFCIYAGLAVIFCFVYMMLVFLPLLALNAQRAEDNRLDCCCCMKARTTHELDKPAGLCACIPFCSSIQPHNEFLGRTLTKIGNFTIKTLLGRFITLIFFFAIFSVGLSGVLQLEKEFKVEWFFPSGSYFEEFSELSKKYWGTGENFEVFQRGVDFFAEQSEMDQLSDYMQVQEYIVDGSVKDWWKDFRASSQTVALDKDAFWAALREWYKTHTPSIHQGSIKWVDPDCNMIDGDESACSPAAGIAHAKIGATLVEFDSGKMRYEVYRTYREDMKEMFDDPTGMKVFPYTGAFLYWEENGIIDVELVRNLIIACGVIFTIVAALIPYPRIALLVALNICAAIVEVIGFAHYWGVTMNGVSTIYFLICVGLAVDYSAHIAHTFTDSSGTSENRALSALQRIGPSVFHAVFSTFLAVVVLGFSKSFVFQVFFKILCLVSFIAGGHGLWLLPTLLGQLGGSTEEMRSVTPTSLGKVDVSSASVGVDEEKSACA